MRRNLARFRRQIGAVSESITFLVPRRDLAGARLAPATGLSLLARGIEGIKDPAALIVETREEEMAAWPSDARAVAQQSHSVPILPDDGVLRTGNDLLRLRKDDFGVMKRQSPSRFETMLVSPFVWVLNEADAMPRDWTPVEMDILTQGNLYHAVMEHLFPAGDNVPEEAAILAGFDTAFDRAMARKAAFLVEDVWAIEAASMRAAARDMALTWRDRLVALEATVVASELWLEGRALSLPMNGIADTVLELPDGQRLVVDFKTASSGKRRERMEKGWDLQVELYREMIEWPENNGARELAQGGRRVAIAYHLLRDGVTLASGIDGPGADTEIVTGEISGEAIARLQPIINTLGGGTIQLNRYGDPKRFEKLGVAPYALKNTPLAMAFAVPDEEG
ncbi:PD-(D/E)XK nuclease family protein [Profundibacter sp.]